MKIKNQLPIAVIDSGLGGISVLRELIAIMPHENYIYFGDSTNAPYGSKSREEVLRLTEDNLEFLMSRGIKALVIACNTATSAAARYLRDKYPDLPIIGIEPAIKPASEVCEHPRVLVMATPLTLREEKFKALAEKFSSCAEFISLPCPSLAELIEAGDPDSPEIDKCLTDLLSPYKDGKIDAIVLGCTHYPHVKHVIAKHFPPSVHIMDGGLGTARHTLRRLTELELLNLQETDGSIEIINTAGDALAEISRKLLYRQL